MKKYLIISLSICWTLFACANPKPEQKKEKLYHSPELQNPNLKVAYFASGCFWCVESVFQSVRGVVEAVPGYSGGEAKNPTYEQVSSGKLKHAETTKVIYDPLEVDYETLLKVFFGSQDPTTLYKQGPDYGPQYRSIAFYQSEKEKESIEDYIALLEKNKTFLGPIVTEIKKFDVFWEAEEYHHEYESLHPEDPYVKSVSIPRLNDFKAKFPELLKENH